MSPASQKLVIITEKLVWPPIEGRTSVDTMIDIGVVVAVEVHHETFHEPVAPENVKFRCLILRDPMQNAFAEPNGTVYVTTGLLSLLENESELAGVLGHELTHTYNRHLYLENRSMRKKVLTMNILSAAASVAPGGAGFSAGAQVFGAAVQLGAAITDQILVASVYGYSRDKEQEADSNGLATMVAASYDPNAMARSFELLDQGSRYEFEPFDTFYHDHPKLTDRRKFALDYAAGHPVANPRPAPEKEYLAKVAPAICYNIESAMGNRKTARTSSSGPSRRNRRVFSKSPKARQR